MALDPRDWELSFLRLGWFYESGQFDPVKTFIAQGLHDGLEEIAAK